MIQLEVIMYVFSYSFLRNGCIVSPTRALGTMQTAPVQLQHPPCSLLQQAIAITTPQVRNKSRCNYRGNVNKRYTKYSYEKRTRNRNGLKLMWRRLIRGRSSLYI